MVPGTDMARVRITNSGGITFVETLDFTVTTNCAVPIFTAALPTSNLDIKGTGTQTITSGSYLSGVSAGVGCTIAYSLVPNPAWLTINAGTGAITSDITNLQQANVQVKLIYNSAVA